MKIPSKQKIPFQMAPDFEGSSGKRGPDAENGGGGGATAARKKPRDDRFFGSVEAERASTSYGGDGSGAREQRDVEKEGEDERTGWRLLPREERPAAANEQPEDERQQFAAAALEAGAAVRKLAQTKEYLAELCRDYLARYKTLGADIRFPPASPSGLWTSPEEAALGERNASRPSAGNDQPGPFHGSRRKSSTHLDAERSGGSGGGGAAAATFPARSSSSHFYQEPPSECRRMPSDFDAFLKSDVLQLEYHSSNTSYREELLALESQAFRILNSFHQSESRESDTGACVCDGTILCNARSNIKSDNTCSLSRFRSYQFAFQAAAVAEIVRLKSNLMKAKIEAAALLGEDTHGLGFSGARAQGELIKRLRRENESAASELAQLRAEKVSREGSFAEIQTAIQYLEGRISSCTCKHVFPPRKKIDVTTRQAAVAASCELRPAVSVMEQQQRQQDGYEIDPILGQSMRGFHSGVSAEDGVRLDGICEASVEEEVFKLVVKKLDDIKADMGVFVKNLQSRVAVVAGKINRTESRVRPVKVGLFCLKLLIDKLLAKKAEIEASLVDNSDNRLGLKLHFRS